MKEFLNAFTIESYCRFTKYDHLLEPRSLYAIKSGKMSFEEAEEEIERILKEKSAAGAGTLSNATQLGTL